MRELCKNSPWEHAVSNFKILNLAFNIQANWTKTKETWLTWFKSVSWFRQQFAHHSNQLNWLGKSNSAYLHLILCLHILLIEWKKYHSSVLFKFCSFGTSFKTLSSVAYLSTYMPYNYYIHFPFSVVLFFFFSFNILSQVVNKTCHLILPKRTCL